MRDKGMLVSDTNVLTECGVKEVLFLSYPIGSYFSMKGDPDQRYEVKAVGLDDFGNVVYWTHSIGKWEAWETEDMEPWVDELEDEYEKQLETILEHDEPDGIPC
jgi:hypothetical protein